MFQLMAPLSCIFGGYCISFLWCEFGKPAICKRTDFGMFSLLENDILKIYTGADMMCVIVEPRARSSRQGPVGFINPIFVLL